MRMPLLRCLWPYNAGRPRDLVLEVGVAADELKWAVTKSLVSCIYIYNIVDYDATYMRFILLSDYRDHYEAIRIMKYHKVVELVVEKFRVLLQRLSSLGKRADDVYLCWRQMPSVGPVLELRKDVPRVEAFRQAFTRYDQTFPDLWSCAEAFDARRAKTRRREVVWSGFPDLMFWTAHSWS